MEKKESTYNRMSDDLSVHRIEVERQSDELLMLHEEQVVSQERYFDLYNLAPVSYITIDEQGALLEFNLTFANLLGINQNELLLKPFLTRFIFAEDHAAYHYFRKKLFETNKQQTCEFRMLKEDGTFCYMYMEAIIRLFGRTSDGEFKQAHCILQDITNLKHIEKDLREDNERFHQMFHEHSAIMLLIDTETGMICDANLAAAKFYGYAVEKLCQINISQINALPNEGVSLKRTRALTENIGYFVFPQRLFSGELRIVEVYSSLIKMRDKSMFFYITHDITERVNLEKALIESERLNAVGQLSAGIAHDFNNNLQMIIGYLDLAMLDQDINPNLAELVNSARKKALDVATSVRQLQQFGKKNRQVDFRSVDINELLEDVISQSKPLWKDESEKKGLSFSFRRNYGKIEAVDGEAGNLRNALHNLVKNAIEAMPDGGLISLETGVSNGNVYIRITDTGMGMDSERKQRIFEPFFTTKGLQSGMGIGMNIVYYTIKNHGGEVFVKESEIGKGTTIEVLLPFRINKQDVLEGKAPVVRHHCLRVLWVDDEKIIGTVGQRYLKCLGHSADVATSGEEAIRLLEKNAYDVMITDIGMPNMNGWQLIGAIDDHYPEMKIAVLSGWGAGAFEKERAMYNVQYVLGKPTTLVDLKKMLDEMF